MGRRLGSNLWEGLGLGLVWVRVRVSGKVDGGHIPYIPPIDLTVLYLYHIYMWIFIQI